MVNEWCATKRSNRSGELAGRDHRKRTRALRRWEPGGYERHERWDGDAFGESDDDAHAEERDDGRGCTVRRHDRQARPQDDARQQRRLCSEACRKIPARDLREKVTNEEGRQQRTRRGAVPSKLTTHCHKRNAQVCAIRVAQRAARGEQQQHAVPHANPGVSRAGGVLHLEQPCGLLVFVVAHMRCDVLRSLCVPQAAACDRRHSSEGYKFDAHERGQVCEAPRPVESESAGACPAMCAGRASERAGDGGRQKARRKSLQATRARSTGGA